MLDSLNTVRNILINNKPAIDAISVIFKGILAIINLLFAGFLVYQGKKMYVLLSKSDLVFSFHSLNQSNVIGRLENIGNTTAYNIKVKIDPDFEAMNNSLQNTFDKLTYLAPKQRFDIYYGFININHELLGVVDHKLTISWSKSQKNPKNPKKKLSVTFQFNKEYFKNFPTQ